MSGQGTMIYPNLEMKKFLYEQGKPVSDALELSPAEISACHKVIEEMKEAKAFGSRNGSLASGSRNRNSSLRRSSRQSMQHTKSLRASAVNPLKERGASS